MRAALAHTVRMRPWRSKVTEAHSPPRRPRAVDTITGSLPSGPLAACVSLTYESPCMLFEPPAAMNGCCGTGVPTRGRGTAARPLKRGTRR